MAIDFQLPRTNQALQAKLSLYKEGWGFIGIDHKILAGCKRGAEKLNGINK